ncbi:hypothetical protein [Streptomyces litchfieldiae]|uniref:Uncharacterized protein n=1 Tax=Streptomyces litchfieldiae TaxID=3075543 RepID=A0ABU2N177_9ACTN|nr:hypothetical protein [Streptomyces sp. DSM 44938]MDT0347644.1 hypothetical protein [Streptomyces sp. DSM 44938]
MKLEAEDSAVAWLPSEEQGVRSVPCGRWFHAVRVVAADGRRAADRLGPRSGPVIEDQAAGTACWLVAPRAADTWRLAGVRVLGAGREIAVPPASWTAGPSTRWLVPPRGDCLTAPGPLHDVLAVTTLEQPRPIESFRTSECHMGTHDGCTKAEAPPSPRGLPVIYQACDCWCHQETHR